MGRDVKVGTRWAAAGEYDQRIQFRVVHIFAHLPHSFPCTNISCMWAKSNSQENKLLASGWNSGSAKIPWKRLDGENLVA